MNATRVRLSFYPFVSTRPRNISEFPRMFQSKGETPALGSSTWVGLPGVFVKMAAKWDRRTRVTRQGLSQISNLRSQIISNLKFLGTVGTSRVMVWAWQGVDESSDYSRAGDQIKNLNS
jgi:hypothetical protein